MTAEGGETVNEARRLDLRLVVAVVFVLAAIWAATALAGGPQQASGDTGGAGNSPTLVYVQDEGAGGTPDDGTPPSGDDCPERGGGGSGGSGGDGTPDV
jgi:hypothetical protein